MKATTFLKNWFYQTLKIFIRKNVTSAECNLKTTDKEKTIAF